MKYKAKSCKVIRIKVVAVKAWWRRSKKEPLEWQKCIQEKLPNKWAKVGGKAAGSKYGRALVSYWNLETLCPK